MKKIKIGINNSFYTHNLFTLYYNFFNNIGCEVIIPNNPDIKGLNYEFSQFCYPMQLSLMLFYDLIINKNDLLDYYFVPAIFELDAEKSEIQRLDFNCACAFVTGEPYILKQAYKEFNIDNKFISPSLNFNNGYEKEVNSFIKIANQIGVTDKQFIIDAYFDAINKQKKVQKKLYSIGKDAMNSDELTIILFGRTYNSTSNIANKGIPKKIASKGVRVIPIDMIDVSGYDNVDRMYWEIGHKIIRIAELVKSNKNFFAIYITNFSCAPDSMLLNTFRNIMGAKPSLTLELDSHSADAGINTRIDAFFDIINNYRRNFSI
jgi:predicted nucleotide-binding protein (sugar kinase/HSP70/actin superfamily)